MRFVVRQQSDVTWEQLENALEDGGVSVNGIGFPGETLHIFSGKVVPHDDRCITLNVEGMPADVHRIVQEQGWEVVRARTKPV